MKLNSIENILFKDYNKTVFKYTTKQTENKMDTNNNNNSY